jgi:antitoxin (DNA-binding transcriptional repressor) of toxin-antitoxin stability system
MTVTDARAALPEIIERVLAGEEVTLTRHGKAVAVVVRPDRLRSRQADAALQSAASVHDLLERGRAALAAEPVMSAADAEARACELRAERDAT